MASRPTEHKDRVRAASGQILIIAAGPEMEGFRDLLRGSPYGSVETPDLATAALLLPRMTPPSLVLIDDSATGDLVLFLGRLQRTTLGEDNIVPAILLQAVDGASPRGISEVVTKPFEAPLLLEVIQRLLERG
jgi:hypothetical protein